MLSNLLIKNYALIKELEMEPDKGLNIITGETGAGKSIMLGAIGLLLGNRADVKALYDEHHKCVIEGSFDLTGYDLADHFEDEGLDFSHDCIVRREIAISGKSRAFINDTPVTLDVLRRIAGQLLDIHSQHDSLLLGSSDFQLQVVDTYAGNSSLRATYQTHFRAYREATKRYQELRDEAVRLRKAFDFDQFLSHELINANLQRGEQEALEQELTLLEHAAEIKEKLQLAHSYLDSPEVSIVDLLKNAVAILSQASRLVSTYEPLKERAQSCLIELRDLADEIETTGGGLEVDEKRKGFVGERLDSIYNLLKKHHVSDVTQLLDIQTELSLRVATVLNLDAALEEAKESAAKAEELMMLVARSLSESRLAVIEKIEMEILSRLSELGIANAGLEIKVLEVAPGPLGKDAVSFLFSANKGIALQGLRQVASGGEFSRLMMVIKYILADKQKLPTIIFDEIDTGVSGEIAKKMGRMMAQMAENHQIIAITHLHQIASSGNAHYFVYKDHSADRTVSKIRKLALDERVMEVAQMIAGDNPGESVLRNARDMILKS
jgi:DNA repair protein RecN (Recombination protein N)